jgi:hypothetical protein
MAPLARRQRRAQPWDAPPARQATRRSASRVKMAQSNTGTARGEAVLVGLSVSQSQPPRQGAPAASHAVTCDRFATLDPPTAHQGSGAYAEAGGGAVIGSGRTTSTGHR